MQTIRNQKTPASQFRPISFAWRTDADMTERYSRRKTIVAISCLIFVILPVAARAVVEPVRVTIESERHVTTPHINKNNIFLPLKLTMSLPVQSKKYMKMRISAGPVMAGAGLVVKQVLQDGTVTEKKCLEPEPWWFEQAETIEIAPNFIPKKELSLESIITFWILPGQNFDFSKEGMYYISYKHPWADPNDPNCLKFTSNTLPIAIVSMERYEQLCELNNDPKLVLASYRLKNPNTASEFAKYRRDFSVFKYISVGDKRDKVLYLTGTPDTLCLYPEDQRNSSGCDECWLWEVSPVSCYVINFKNGRVISISCNGDSDSDSGVQTQR